MVFICVVMFNYMLRNALESSPFIIHGTPTNPENRQNKLLIGLFGRQSLVTSAEEAIVFGLGLAARVDALGRFFNLSRLFQRDTQALGYDGRS